MGDGGRPVIGPSLPPGWRRPATRGAAEDSRREEGPGEEEDPGRAACSSGRLPGASLASSATALGNHTSNGRSATGPPLPPVQLGWGHPQGCGCGLNNLGNSCYLNSVLQALAYLPPVGQRALSRQHGRACPRTAAGHADCAACLVEARLGRCLRGDPAQPESPMQLLNNLGLLSSGLRRYQQEDAHEALRLVVDAMHRDCLRATFGWGYKPPPGQKEPESAVSQLFGGELQSGVRCLVCGHESVTVDPTMDLSLEVAGCASLAQALDRFTAVERLDGGSVYHCERCAKLVPAEKRIAIRRAPHCLAIHLKRFDAFSGGKIGRPLSFREDISLAPYMVPGAPGQAAEGLHYKLCSLVVHTGGSANSGHYYAYVRDGLGRLGQWHCMDDGCVAPAGRDLVFREPAYLLMYCRREARPSQAASPASPASSGAAPSPRLLGANGYAAAARSSRRSSLCSEGSGPPLIGPAWLPPAMAAGDGPADEAGGARERPSAQELPAKRAKRPPGLDARQLLAPPGGPRLEWEHLNLPRLSAEEGRHFEIAEIHARTRDNVKANLARLLAAAPLWPHLRSALAAHGPAGAAGLLEELRALVRREPEAVVGEQNWQMLGLQVEHCCRLLMDDG
eukprot:jgi/Tetstr1/429369/TSEL_019284.t1